MPFTSWGFSVYDEIITKLVASGIPRVQIAAVGDADSDARKQALFERVRNGSVRVLIGSTQKMGTGTNVQKRLVALHHLDAPWKPAEVEQREGRILRQGNDNPEVAIYRYVTEGSFDAYMWQALETKARFIAQVMTGESGVRRAEDIGGQELSYAEVKAIASGNPAVLTLAEADAELQRLAVLKKNHADEQYLARLNLKELPGTIARLTRRISDLQQDMATLDIQVGDDITIAGRVYAMEDAAKALVKHLNSVPERVHETRRYPLGIYRGLGFGLMLHSLGAPVAYLEGAATRQAMLSGDSHGARAILNALDRLVGSYASQVATAHKDLAIAESQLRDYQARLGRPFAHDAYLAELIHLRDQLKAGLSATTPEPEIEAIPVTELSVRIKSVIAGHTLEAAPQRASSRPTVAAEEPVTSRIRRRGEPVVALAEVADLQEAPAESPLQTTPPIAATARSAQPPSLAPTPVRTEEEPILFRLEADGTSTSRSRSTCREGIMRDRPERQRQLNLF